MTVQTLPAAGTDTRILLAGVHRWARTHGWQRTWSGWRNFPTGVGLAFDDGEVSVWRPHPRTGRWPSWPVTYRVDTVRQGVDILCALQILPVHFSSAYEAGRAAPRVRTWVSLSGVAS